MIHYTITPGTADVTLNIFIPDASSSVGAGLTGLVFNTASLVCYYAREKAAAAALSLATQTVTGAHSDGGFVEIDATNMPGVYRLDLSDAVCAVNVTQAWVELKGAANMVPVLINIKLNNTNADVIAISGDATAADNCELMFDGTGYAGGTAKLTVNTVQVNGTSQTAGDIPALVTTVDTVVDAILVDTGTTLETDLDAIIAAVITNAAGVDIAADIIAVKADTAAILTDTGTTLDAALAVVDANVDAILVDTAVIGAAGAGLTHLGGMSTTIKTQVETEANDALVANNLDHIALTAVAIPAIPAGTYIDQMMDDGTAVYDRTTDSLQAIRDRGDAAWDTADVSALALQTSVDDLEGRLSATRAGYLDNLSAGAVALEATAQSILTDTAVIGAAGAGLTAVPWNATWDAEVQSEVDDALDTTVADSVPADGTRPTFEQALYMIWQFLAERSVSGTTVTVKKADGSTGLMTFTLNDDTTPTSITRAT